MKRVLPLLIIVSTLEIWSFVAIGKFLFKQREADISEITIVETTSTGDIPYLIKFHLNDNKSINESYMSHDEYNTFKKTGKIYYHLCDTYIGWTILYIAISICFIFYFILRTIDFFVIYYSRCLIGNRFDSYDSIFPDCYAEFYNAIDSYDLTPFKDKFKSFFGY